ncbi:MAG: hypothetical protein ACI867_000726 [Glaciecola sp.]
MTGRQDVDMSDFRHRDARAEASALLPGELVAAVLEPSPPAVNVDPWFADDPLGPARVDRQIISPLRTGDVTWADVTGDDPSLALFARAHWLANHKPLASPPASYDATRRSLLALAFFVISPARHQANGKIALRWTKGGFGTPFFDDDRQVRVDGTHIVVQHGEDVTVAPITTLRAAGTFVGIQPGPPSGIDFHDMPDMPDLDEALEVDAAAVEFLDDWFGFATFVLHKLHFDAGSPPDTRVQIWSEHFDPAIELGDTDHGRRASFGASPGDAGIGVPYLYVAPWKPQEGDFWNAPFGGAALTIDELRAAPDATRAAMDFFRRGRSRLS